MNIIIGYPPNYETIKEAFDIGNMPNVIFTYGGDIYSPGGDKLPDHIIHHEQTHIKQQVNPEEWWDRYIKDPDFRLTQEVEAYHAQYQFIKANYNREFRRHVLTSLVKDLSGPMYGNMVNKEVAEMLIKGDDKWNM